MAKKVKLELEMKIGKKNTKIIGNVDELTASEAIGFRMALDDIIKVKLLNESNDGKFKVI